MTQLLDRPDVVVSCYRLNREAWERDPRPEAPVPLTHAVQDDQGILLCAHCLEPIKGRWQKT